MYTADIWLIFGFSSAVLSEMMGAWFGHCYISPNSNFVNTFLKSQQQDELQPKIKITKSAVPIERRKD